MDRVWFSATIFKVNQNAVALSCAEGGPGHVAIVDPGRIFDPLGHLQLLILRPDVILALRRAIGQPRFLAVIERGEKLHWIHLDSLSRRRSIGWRVGGRRC